MACGLQEESRHEEAIDAFREAIRLENPGGSDLYYNFGVSLSHLRRWEEAAGAYENAAQLDPSRADAWEGVGSAYVMFGRWGDAAACYDRVRRLSPTLGRGVDAAYVLMEVNRLEEAESLLREVLKIDPDCLDTKELFAQTLAGLDRYDESIRVARDICAADPKRSSAHAILGMVLAEAGQLDEALSEAKAAVEIAPQDGYAHGAVGTVYLKMTHGAAALAAFERARAFLAIATEPPDPATSARCACGRGVALSLLGRHDEAMSAFDELLRVEPDFFERWPEQAASYELSRRETTRGS